MNNFYNALFQANLLYGLKLNEIEFEEIGLIAWNFIGNKNTRLYKFCTTPTNGEIQLPCNCDLIEAVTYTFEDWNRVTGSQMYGDFTSQYNESLIEAQKTMNNPLYINGRFVKYRREGDTLIINDDVNMPIQILYHGVILDDNSLPLINNKEVNAIAAYCAFVTFRKEYFSTLNKAIYEKSLIAEQDWKKFCDAARVSEKIDQNDMNMILDAKTNWNRKIFNKSYKPLK
jgi:hypothetical protein